MAHRIASKPTMFNGIKFRSRLEAAWYSYFARLGMQPEYEPLSIEVRTWGIAPPGEDIWQTYLPDFRVQANGRPFWVEIKPLVEEFEQRDQRSIGLACILGYSEPTAIICGSPLRHFGCVITERHKGCPEGTYLRVGAAGWEMHGNWYLSGYYPDEGELEVAHVMHDYDKRYVEDMSWFEPAAEAWNDTKWHP